MATNKTLLYCVLVLNLLIVIVNITAWQHLWGSSKKMPMEAFTILNTPNSKNLRGSNSEFMNEDSLDQNSTADAASFPSDPPEEGSESLPSHPPNLPAPHFVHPFDRLSTRLDQLNWDPQHIDEVVRKYWKIEKSFLRYYVDRHKKIHQILSTSCLHTAAWIVQGLLELQTRPNIFKGFYHVPNDKNLIVYQNTQSPPSTLAAPVIQSIKSFVDARPLNESIVLQIDMYHLLTPPIRFYIDHHFAIHIYNGSISLYQAWQDEYNLLEWMQDPGMFKQRYPMPLDTFLGHFEKFLTYTDELDIDRLKSVWEIFGTSKTFDYHPTKGSHDATVRALRFPWALTLITHWPHAPLGLEGAPV